MTRILVTGAAGYIGAALATALAARGRDVRAVSRQDGTSPSLGRGADWGRALEGVSAIVHAAGPAHARFTERYLQDVIVGGAETLARQAARAGVKRFIFISSIKAVASRTQGAPLTEAMEPAPQDAYGRAKRDAEMAVLAHEELAPLALRPPLVFAPDAKANFALLLRLAASPAPLPLAGFANARSLLARETLIEAICAALSNPAPRGAFYVTERPALSTPEMITALRVGLGRKPALFHAPFAQKLAPLALRESLEADDSMFRAVFGFSHGQDARAALAACAAAWAGRR